MTNASEPSTPGPETTVGATPPETAAADAAPSETPAAEPAAAPVAAPAAERKAEQPTTSILRTVTVGDTSGNATVVVDNSVDNSTTHVTHNVYETPVVLIERSPRGLGLVWPAIAGIALVAGGALGLGLRDRKPVTPEPTAAVAVDRLAGVRDAAGANLVFEHDSARINADGMVRVERLASEIRRLPEGQALCVTITGGASRPGTEQHNGPLSASRALNVRDQLVGRFNVDPDVVRTVGAGASEASGNHEDLDRNVRFTVQDGPCQR